ncbi:MAG TPA: SDR family oxidoreductase [Myxococcota bacterium]|nr:SDR family oxidoreductase [Myxococcota bacterium]
MATQAGIRTFEDAVALVTGGASGIGKALTEALSSRGCVVVAADRDAEAADEVARSTQGRGAVGTFLDVRDPKGFQEVVRRTFETHGRLDFLFNNAGITGGGEVVNSTIDDWRAVIEVNLFGVIHGVLAAYPLMRRQGFGHIVNTASMAGLVPTPFAASYSTTKHAVVGLSKALRAEASYEGVRVSVLCPGAIRTPILEGGRYGVLTPGIPEDEQRRILRQFWQRYRPMDPLRFAHAALDAVARDKAIVVIPSWCLWWIERASPTLSLFLARRVLAKSMRGLFGPGCVQGRDTHPILKGYRPARHRLGNCERAEPEP